MKVGIVCPYNMYKGGGVQECVRAIQAELQKRGHSAKIITPQPREVGEPMNDVVFIGGAAQIKSPFHTTAQVSVSVNIDNLNTILDIEKFDILHFHEPWVPILSRQILSRSFCPNVSTFHAKLPDTIMSKTIERVITPYTKSILKDLHCLTAVSEAAAEYVQSISKEIVKIIPNGIDLSSYAKTAKQNTKPNILYIGRLEKRKGVKYLLQAFNILRQTSPQVELNIVGDGPDRQKLQQLVKQLGLRNVHFLGYVDEEEKLRLLKSAMVFCSPAIFGESFGIVLLEALAVGVPIVAGNNPGYTAVLKERGSIGLVNPKDSVDFARKLSLLLNDQELRKLWQSWAKEYVKQFSYAHVVDQYEALYKEVLSQKK